MSNLNKDLEEILEAFCEEAPGDASYPYKVFSAKRISEEDGKSTYVLEVNVWDQGRFYSRAENIMSALEQQLHRFSYMTDDFLITFYKGQRQNVTDSDKSLKRVREQFEMYVWERKDR